MRSKMHKFTNSCALLSTVKITGKQQRGDLLLDGRNDVTRNNEQVEKYT